MMNHFRFCLFLMCQDYLQSRRLCFFAPMALDTVKQVKNKFGCTVNDVATACLCAGFRKYMELREDPSVESKRGPLFRVLIPYFLPRLAGGANQGDNKDNSKAIVTLHNNWCFLSLALPLKLTQPRERLEFIIMEMSKLKKSPEAYLQLKINEAGSAVLPFAMASQTAKDIMLKHSCVFTNVPGPQIPTYMSGSQVSALSVFVNNNVPQVSLISFNGQVRTTMVADNGLLPQMEKIGEYMSDELQALLHMEI
jgi:diacylglycerol O-acyltransferase